MIVVEGDLSDQELIQIATGLKSPSVKVQKRSYFIKKILHKQAMDIPKPVEAVNVPISFWKFPLEDSRIKFQTAFRPFDIPDRWQWQPICHYLVIAAIS